MAVESTGEVVSREDELCANDWAAVVTAAQKAKDYYYDLVSKLGGGIDGAYFPIKIEVISVNDEFEPMRESFVLDDHPERKGKEKCEDTL